MFDDPIQECLGLESRGFISYNSRRGRETHLTETGRDHLKRANVVFLGLFLFGAWIRSLDVWRPVDGRVRESWRECDYAAVARNFYREGMNILCPRIDWRGDGPGYAEMEFPIIPWTMAALYKVFGYQEVLGRVLIYAFSLLTLFIFFLLARRLLPLWGAFAASLFFVLSPLAVRVSNSLQPEAPMLFFYIAAAYSFIRWLEAGRWIWYGAALIAAALAILVKASAAHIGIFFLLLFLADKGFRALRSAKVWAFGFLALLPSLVWYIHAHHLWLAYGNSLGVSNEYHWLGWDLLKNPFVLLKFISRLLKREALLVWMPLGWIAGLAVLWIRKKEKAVKIVLFWLLALGLYYLVAIRTTADSWAAYYHVATVPPAALLFGVCATIIRDRLQKDRPLAISMGISIFISLALIAGRVLLGLTYDGIIQAAVVLSVLSAIAAIPLFLAPKPFNTVWLVFLVSFLSVFPFQAVQIGRDLHPRQFLAKFACALNFKPLIPETALILASGGVSRDETGRPVAYNASYMFFWTDRKGFNIPSDQLSLDHVRDYLRRGVGYFVLEKDALKANPGFAAKLRKNFTLLAECAEAFLFKL
jgi:4-amino-4-deoxy-L-arabinose transferase-like glycosyltransferase